MGHSCALPFVYNGFEYKGCTSVDETEAWPLRGVGLCQHGYLASVAAHGGTLEQCQTACLHARAVNCSLISYTSAGGGYCSGYTAACKERPLNGAKVEYLTHEFHDDGGAWCPTEVGPGRTFLKFARSGVCGPGCPLSDDKDRWDPKRSRCHGAMPSNGQGSHCGPSPPPPPRGPLPPMVPPSLPPPLPPPPSPSLPPPPSPGLLMLLGTMQIEQAAATIITMAMFCLGLSVFLAASCRTQSVHRLARRVRRRHIAPEELEALSSHGAENEGARRSRVKQGNNGFLSHSKDGGGGRQVSAWPPPQGPLEISVGRVRTGRGLFR